MHFLFIFDLGEKKATFKKFFIFRSARTVLTNLPLNLPPPLRLKTIGPLGMMLQLLLPNPNLSLPMIMRIGRPLTNNPKLFKKRLQLKSLTPKASNKSQCFTISMRKTGTN